MRPPHPTTRPRSAAAVASLILGILGAISTFPLFGVFTLLPALAALTGAYGLRTTHAQQLRGRALALWGFWLGCVFFLINVGLLLLAAIGMRMGS